MIIPAQIHHTKQIWWLLNDANDSSLSHYSMEEVKIFKKENTHELIEKYIWESGYQSFVYTNLDGDILWYYVYSISNHMLYRLYVDPKAQWKWIGTQLIEYVKKLFQKLWVDTLYVPSRKNAVSFYEKIVFVKTGKYQDWNTCGWIFQQNILELKI